MILYLKFLGVSQTGKVNTSETNIKTNTFAATVNDEEVIVY